MAKKRLNKKAALVGSVIFVLVVVLAIGLFLYLSRDPRKFIKDGDIANAAASQMTDPNQQKELYKDAERNYKKAYGLGKSDELKVEMLYRLADVYVATEDWRDVLGCWNQIVRLDPKNIKARYGRLKYSYIVADTISGMVWQDVATQASEFMEIIEKPGADPELVSRDTTEWELDALKEKKEPAHQLGPYLYLIRGRANLETSRLGMVTNKTETLKQAVADLEKVRQLEPQNVDMYLYLAQSAIVAGDIEASKGNLEAQKEGQDKALELLRQGIEATKDSVQSNIYLLTVKHFLALTNMTPDQQKEILALEPEYLALGSKFGSNAEVLSTIAGFYSDFHLGTAYIDKAIEAADKAMELDNNNTDYALLAANLYSRRYILRNQEQDMNKAIEIAEKALLSPDVQTMAGPRLAMARAYQMRFNGLLANIYISQILDSQEPPGQAEGQQALAQAQKAVRQIEQVLGSGDDPQVTKWQGLVELAAASLAKEDNSAAIQKLYKTYTQLKASARPDPYLAYRLAKIFVNSPESGAVGEFTANAIQNGIEGFYPEARLDYAEILLRAAMWKMALLNIDVFEQRCGETDRSRVLRIGALINSREFDQAQRYLDQMPQHDPNTLLLKAAFLQGKARQIRATLARKEASPRTSEVLQNILSRRQPQEAVDQRSNEQLAAEMKEALSAFIKDMDILLEKDPNSLDPAIIVSMCDDAIATGRLDAANLIAEKLTKYQPENPTAIFYKQLLAEPDPSKVDPNRVKQIREDVLAKIADPVRRAMSLGMFYQMNNEPNRAIEHFKKLAGISTGTEALQADEGMRNRAAGFLFDLALEKNDLQLVDKIVQIAQQENLDGCSGNFFAARAYLSKEQYEKALASIDAALAQRPVFGYGYMMRARINAALGKDEAALTDIQMAAMTNPLDRIIARELTNQLYKRNQKLGKNVSPSQSKEARDALDWAMALNPGDLQLTSFYAEYISDSDPNRALALRQSLQENTPSIQNALLLARLAMRLALESTDTQRKQTLFGMAGTALEQAKSYDPQNMAVLDSYSEYYRLTGQEEKAEQLLATTKESGLLWRHYIRAGRFEDAQKTLEKSYKANPKDTDALKGLLYLAERTGDRQAVAKYSEGLLSAEDTADNHLLVVQTYLNAGIVNEAEQKLASFREKYPTNGGGLLLGAWLYMRQGKPKDALELINKRLEGDQSDATAWRLRGQINLMLADKDQAIMDLKRSKTLLDSPVTRVSLAKAYLRTGRTEDAITELKNIFEDPQSPEEARSLLEQIYAKTGRTEALKDFYEKVLKKLPDSVYWNMRAAGIAGGGGDYTTAAQLYSTALQKSIEQGKPNADALGGYLRALMEAGKMDKVFEEAGKYIDGNLAPVAYYRIAESKMKLGDRDSAVQYCNKALEKAGDNTELVMYVIAKTEELLGQKDTEQICLQKLKVEPGSFAANWAMYGFCRAKGDYNKSLEYIEKCLAASGEQQERGLACILQKAEVLILAFMKTSDNNYLQRAMEVYESLLAKMPNNTGILNNMAYILAENDKDLDKALEYTKRTYEIKPDDPGYLDTHAYVLYKMGKYSEAAQFGQAAIQQYETQQIPPPPEAYEHLGQAQEQLGETLLARSAYEQALETGGENLTKPVKERITAAIERLKAKGDVGNDSEGQ